MTIGAFAERTRLSAKALRLYDRLGLLPPVLIDPANGYRFYSEEQVGRARLVALLRRLDMPLSVIGDVLAKPGLQAAEAVGDYWADIESATVDRRGLVSYLQALLTGADMTSYEIQTRTIPERKLVAISRHLHLGETDAFFSDAFARLRSAGPGLPGAAGTGGTGGDSNRTAGDFQQRTEAAHDEAFIRLTMKEMGWPALAPAVDALEAWVRQQQREIGGALRQVLIADQRTATADTPVCDLSVPLK